MTLKEQIEADALTVFCNANDFAESVVYHPHRFFGEEASASRTIDAIVIRESLTVLTEDGDTIVPVFFVHVANDVTNGITSDELDLGGDQIELRPREGETAERRSITRLVAHDNGMLELQCQ